jgi:hypothetical protein
MKGSLLAMITENIEGICQFTVSDFVPNAEVSVPVMTTNHDVSVKIVRLGLCSEYDRIA